MTNLRFTLPNDPDRSRFRFVIVAAQRARELHAGARPKIPVVSKKPVQIAIKEAELGLIGFDAAR